MTDEIEVDSPQYLSRIEAVSNAEWAVAAAEQLGKPELAAALLIASQLETLGACLWADYKDG